MMQLGSRANWAGRLLSAAALCSANAVSQPRPLTPIEGFESSIAHLEPGSPFALRGFAVDQTSTLYLSVDNRILRREANSSLTELLRFPQNESTGLFSIPSGRAVLVFTNFNTNRCYQLDLRTNVTSSFAGIKNAFDVDVTRKGDILMTANPNWPSTGAKTGVYVLDPLHGRHREIIRLTGPSGPLLITPNGDLLYAIQSDRFPTPPGSVELIRFTSSQVASALSSSVPLPMNAGTVVMRGLDGAADLALDDRRRLYISDPQHGGILRTWPGRFALEPEPFVKPSKLMVLGLAFVDTGLPTMDSYQPSNGADLYAFTTDWTITAEVRRITPRRPRLQATPNPAPKGQLQLKVTEAPRNAATWVGLSLLPDVPERPVFFAEGVSLFLGLDFLVPPFLLTGTTSPGGSLTLNLTHPGQFLLTLNAQTLVGGPPRSGFVQVATTNLHRIYIKP